MSLQDLMLTEWVPQPYLVYKPQKNGNGVAMRVQLRLEPTWEATEAGYKRPVVKGDGQGGLFLELAAQTGFGEGGHASFGWADGKLLRVKLGLPDVTKILTAIREVRLGGRELPASFRGKDQQPYSLNLFHKFGEGGTAIAYTLEAERSLIRVSKSKDWARSIALELHEELGLETYLHHALRAFLRVGVR